MLANNLQKKGRKYNDINGGETLGGRGVYPSERRGGGILAEKQYYILPEKKGQFQHTLLHVS